MESLNGIVAILFWIFVILLLIFGNSSRFKMKDLNETYGYLYNKYIDIENVPVFRDIPFDGNIYYAYVLIKLNNFRFEDSNILVGIILKWVKDKKICIRKIDDVRVIDLTVNSKFDISFEDELFKMMYEASDDGILEVGELFKWAKNYDMRFLGLFMRMEMEIINSLKKETHIYHRITEEECMYDYVMDDKIYEDSVMLCGFRKFLEDFSLMDMKEIMELHLWEEYLIFAALFGMTDKIGKQLKELYPDMEKIDMYDLI